MALTDKQVYDLNNMNVAAQNAKLGDLLKDGAGEEGEPYVLPAASEQAIGGVKKMPTQANSTATGTDVDTLTADFNSLLAKLKAAGMMS